MHFLDTFSTCGVLYILTWKCASRHNGVHFFMSHLASWLLTRRFSEPTFRPSGATNHWKNTVFRDFPIFSRIYLFFLPILSLLTLLTSAFQLSILSEVSLLNFLRQYIPLHSNTLNYTMLHSTTLHDITLHYTTFHYTSLHYTTLHSTTLQLQQQLHNYTPLHSTTIHYITLHYIPLHSTTLH